MDELNGRWLSGNTSASDSFDVVYSVRRIFRIDSRSIPKRRYRSFHFPCCNGANHRAHGCDIVAPILLWRPLTFVGTQKIIRQLFAVIRRTIFCCRRKVILFQPGEQHWQNSRKMKITELTGLLENLSEKAIPAKNSLPSFSRMKRNICNGRTGWHNMMCSGRN